MESLTKEQRNEIISRVEGRIGLRHFIVPESLPVSTTRRLCSKCGWTEAEGYWLCNNTGICEPCVKVVAGVIALEEIK